jgi:hypothetical protein
MFVGKLELDLAEEQLDSRDGRSRPATFAAIAVLPVASWAIAIYALLALF